MKKVWSKTRALTSAVTISAVLAATLAGCGKSQVNENIQSATVETGALSQQVSGTGTLLADTAKEVSVPVGIRINKVLVKEGDEIKASTPIATVDPLSCQRQLLTLRKAIQSKQEEIDGLDSASEYYSLSKSVYEGELGKLKATESKLEDIMSTGIIMSDADGVVNKINMAENKDVSKTSYSTTSDYLSGMSGLSSLSSVMSDATGMAERKAEGSSREAGAPRASFMAVKGAPRASFMAETAGQTDASSPAEKKLIPGTVNLSITAPVEGATPQSTLNIDEQAGFTGTITWNPAPETFSAGTTYSALVVLKAKEGYAFAPVYTDIHVNIDSSNAALYYPTDSDGDGSNDTLFVMVPYPAAPVENPNPTPAITPEQIREALAGLDLSTLAPQVDTNSLIPSVWGNAGTAGDLSALAGLSSLNKLSSVDISGSSTFTEYETAGITVTPTEHMLLNVNISELDILQIAKGQKTDVTLDAVDNKTYQGTVTSIAGTASSSSSSSVAKFVVEITMDRDVNMRAGMSATAKITTGEVKNALLIPVDALQNQDGRLFVYTKKDDKGNLSEEKEITTGYSNSEKVQVTAGLTAGDTVYYEKKKVASNPFAEMNNMSDDPSSTSTTKASK